MPSIHQFVVAVQGSLLFVLILAMETSNDGEGIWNEHAPLARLLKSEDH
jgi:hypothetical protein